MIHILDKIPITATKTQVIEQLRVTEEEDIAIAIDLFKRVREIARPKAMYRESFVDGIEGDATEGSAGSCIVRIGGVTFRSQVVAMALAGVHRVFPYVCTCGTEVDEWSRTLSDYVMQVWVDMIKQMLVYDAVIHLRDHISHVFGFNAISSVNPGSGNLENWPIAQQVQLFELVGEVKESIGVTLTDNYLMIPTKSTSGIYFPSETAFVNCALCNRENCQGRRAEFDSSLYEKAFMG